MNFHYDYNTLAVKHLNALDADLMSSFASQADSTNWPLRALRDKQLAQLDELLNHGGLGGQVVAWCEGPQKRGRLVRVCSVGEAVLLFRYLHLAMVAYGQSLAMQGSAYDPNEPMRVSYPAGAPLDLGMDRTVQVSLNQLYEGLSDLSSHCALKWIYPVWENQDTLKGLAQTSTVSERRASAGFAAAMEQANRLSNVVLDSHNVSGPRPLGDLAPVQTALEGFMEELVFRGHCPKMAQDLLKLVSRLHSLNARSLMLA